jgi:hypothetical protein
MSTHLGGSLDCNFTLMWVLWNNQSISDLMDLHGGFCDLSVLIVNEMLNGQCWINIKNASIITFVLVIF